MHFAPARKCSTFSGMINEICCLAPISYRRQLRSFTHEDDDAMTFMIRYNEQQCRKTKTEATEAGV